MRNKYGKKYKVNPDLPYQGVRCFYGMDSGDIFVCKECVISNTTDTTIRLSSYLKKSDCVESWIIDLDDINFKPEDFWIRYAEDDIKIPMFVKREKEKSSAGEIIARFGCLGLMLVFFVGASLGIFALLVWIAGKILHLI